MATTTCSSVTSSKRSSSKRSRADVAYRRVDRVNALLQRELATLISEELRDPRISFPTVTSVETTSDLRTARVFVSVLGDDDAVTSTMKALNEARPFIRREVGDPTHLRFVPQTDFLNNASPAPA